MRHHFQVFKGIFVGHKLIEVCNLFADILACCWTRCSLFGLLDIIGSSNRHSPYIFDAHEVGLCIFFGFILMLGGDRRLYVTFH